MAGLGTRQGATSPAAVWGQDLHGPVCLRHAMESRYIKRLGRGLYSAVLLA